MEYEFNEQAEAIAEHLIKKHHPRLLKIKIAYLFKVKPVSDKPPKPKLLRAGKKEVWAKASKVTDKYLALLEKDFRFVIEFDQAIWDRITLEQQEALVDHELCHCGVDAEGCYMRSHDLEEFREIVKRHGLWKSDIEDFAAALPLFEKV